MKNINRKIVSALLAVILVAGMVPALAFADSNTPEANITAGSDTQINPDESTSPDASLQTQSEELSVSEGESNIDSEHTVTFRIEKDASEVYREFIVSNNDYCPGVSTPQKEGKVFTGWYYLDTNDNDSEKKFEFEMPIVSQMEIYAKYSDEAWVVQFMNPSGTAVLQSLLQAKGTAIGPDSSPDISSDITPVDMVFTGSWLLGSPNGPVYSFSDVVTKDITLYPQMINGYSVFFVSGGSPVSPQAVSAGGTAVEPITPSRTGFTFDGWFEKDSNGNYANDAFDFSSSIHSNVTLYGKWTGVSVAYTINYWLEKPGIIPDDYPGYSWVAGANKPATIAGGELSSAQLKDSSLYNFIGSNTANAAAGSIIDAPNETQLPSKITKAVKDALDPSGVQSNWAWTAFASYGWGDTNVEVSGAGDTVVNVYLVRAVWTESFTLYAPPVASSNIVVTIMGDSGTELYNAGPVSANAVIGTMTLRTKIGLSQLSVGAGFCSTDPYTGETLIQASPSGSTAYFMRGWDGYNSNSPFTFSATSTKISTHCSSSNPTSHVVTHLAKGSTNWAVSTTQHLTQAKQYVESLDQDRSTAVNAEDLDPSNPSKRIYVSEITTNRGVQTINRVLEEDNYYFYLASTGDRQIYGAVSGIASYVGEGVIKDEYGACFQFDTSSKSFYQLKASNNRNDNVRYFFYERIRYDLSFQSQTTGSNPPTQSVMFEESLSTYKPANPTKDNAVFLGWFDSEDATEPFDFSAETMPASNVNLTARWLVQPHSVTFFASSSASDQIASLAQTVSDGVCAKEPSSVEFNPDDYKPTEGSEFLGWYVKIEGSEVLVPFSFETPIEKDTKLYARWNPPYAYNNVSYSSNGGAGTLPSDTLQYNTGSRALVKDGSALTLKDHVFIGWRVNGTGTLYNAGNMIVVNSNITLVAQWIKTSEVITVRFHQNAWSSDPTTTAWNINSGATLNFPFAYDLGFSRSNYAFAGWSTNPQALAASTAYTPGQASSKVYSNLDLYAVWVADGSQYSVYHLLMENNSYSSLSGWPQSYTTAIGEQVSASALNQTGLTHVRTAVGEDPHASTSTSQATTASLTVGSMQNNSYANTITFYYVANDEEDDEAVTPPPAQGSLAPPTPPSNAAPGTPGLDLFGQEVPLLGNTGDVWSWFNLLCTILGILIVIATALRIALIRRNDDEEDANAEANESAQKKKRLAWLEERERNAEEDERTNYKTRIPFFIASLIGAIALVLFFIITQDIMLPIAIFDFWSFAFAIIFVATFGLALLAIAKEKVEEEQKPEEIAEKTPANPSQV